MRWGRVLHSRRNECRSPLTGWRSNNADKESSGRRAVGATAGINCVYDDDVVVVIAVAVAVIVVVYTSSGAGASL